VTADARAWAASREPAPPPALAGAVARALGDALGDVPNADGVTGACLLAAERVLARVLADDASSAAGGAREAARDTGLDLLAADALVTYAFEAAADEPERLGDVARDAMARLSRVAPAASP
jgi:hypothetical protein